MVYLYCFCSFLVDLWLCFFGVILALDINVNEVKFLLFKMHLLLHPRRILVEQHPWDLVGDGHHQLLHTGEPLQCQI